MSRIAKYPVVVPTGVEVTMTANEITVKGVLGKQCDNLVSPLKTEHVYPFRLCQNLS